MSGEIQEAKKTELALSGGGLGFEGIEMEDIRFSAAKVLQNTSAELGDESLSVRQGMIIDSLTKEQMPERFVPIMAFHQNVLFTPKNPDLAEEYQERFKEALGYDLPLDAFKEGMIVCNAPDGKQGTYGVCKDCGLHKFKGGKNPVCTDTINVFAIFEGSAFPVLIRFARTSYKHGKDFLSLAFRFGGNLFDRAYTLKSIKAQQKGNTWWELKTFPGGLATEDEKAAAQSVYAMLSKHVGDLQEKTAAFQDGEEEAREY